MSLSWEDRYQVLVQWARMDGHRFRPSSLSDYHGGITDAEGLPLKVGSFVLASDRHSSEHSLWPTTLPPILMDPYEL